MLSLASNVARRLLSVAAGMDARSASAVRGAALRMMKGEEVAPAELLGLLPKRNGPAGISVGLDENFEPAMLEAYRTVGRVGVVRIDGPIMFSAGILEIFLLGVLPTGVVVEALDQAAGDTRLDTVLLDMHCPGGSVAGASDLAAALERVRDAGKRLVAIAHEQIASMGVWMAAACDEVAVTPTGMVGSVGTLAMYYDDSGMYASEGVEPVLLASSKRKGKGWPGVPIDDAMIDDDRRIIAKHSGEFFERVAKGRRLSVDAVRAMDARMYLADDAKKVGLADKVAGFDEYLAELVDGTTSARVVSTAPAAPDTETAMPTDNNKTLDLSKLTLADLEAGRKDLADELAARGEERAKEAAKPKPATAAELRGALPGAGDFCLDALEKGLTLDQAKGEYLGVLRAEKKELEGKVAALEKEVAGLRSLKNEGRGVEPVSHSERQTAGAGKFEDHVQKTVAEGKTIDQAIVDCVKKHPAEHADWLARGCPKIEAKAA